MRFQKFLFMMIILISFNLFFNVYGNGVGENANYVSDNRDFYFTEKGLITPLIPEEFEIQVPSGLKEGYLGLGIIPQDSANYMEVATFSTERLQAQLNFRSKMTIFIPIYANESTYFDLKISIFMNGINFAPQQELDNQIATDNITEWTMEFNTDDKIVPENANLEIKIEMRVISDNVLILSKGNDVLGIWVDSDAIGATDVQYSEDSSIKISFKECFNVPLEEIFLVELSARQDEDYGDFHYRLNKIIEDIKIEESPNGFIVKAEVILLPGDYFITFRCYYDEMYSHNSYGTQEWERLYFSVDIIVDPKETPSFSAEECERSYHDNRADTWDFIFYTENEKTEGHIELVRGKSMISDILSIHSYQENMELVIDITFGSDVENLDRCEVYLVDPSFKMPSLIYEIGWDFDENFPVIFPEINCTVSSDPYASGNWGLLDVESKGHTLTFREDLNSLNYKGVNPNFEIMVISFDGGYSENEDFESEFHWDYAGYNITEPILIGESEISIYEEKIINKIYIINMIKRIILIAIIVGVIALIITILLMKRVSRKKSEKKESYTHYIDVEEYEIL